MTRFRSLAVSGALLLTVYGSSAQGPRPVESTAAVKHDAAKPAATTATTAHPLERADLEAFFDGVLPLQLERSDIAGASVLVMKDGKSCCRRATAI